MRGPLLLIVLALLSGCAGPNTEEMLPASLAPEGPPEEAGYPTVVELRYDGKTDLGGCVAPVMSGGPCVSRGSENDAMPLLPNGTVQRIVGNLSWNAESGLTSELTVSLVYANNGQVTWLEEVTGSSPISFAWGIANYSGESVFLQISAHKNAETPAAMVVYEASQSFRLEALVTATTEQPL